MEILKYKIIKTDRQYNEYCNKLEQLVMSSTTHKAVQDEIDLLTLLIEKYDAEHNTFTELDPIALIHSLMGDKNMKARDLVSLLEMSKGYVSDILNYKKGLSKEIIRKLSNHFKIAQEAFNKPYKLKSEYNSRLRNASVMNTTKEVATT